MNIPLTDTDTPDVNHITTQLEALGFGWDVGYTGRLRECRIWAWPHVVGRYRPAGAEPLHTLLLKAIADARKSRRYDDA